MITKEDIITEVENLEDTLDQQFFDEEEAASILEEGQDQIELIRSMLDDMVIETCEI